MPDATKALESFGQLLVSRVRDEAIVDWDMILDGRMKDASSQLVRAELETRGFSREQLDFVQSLIPKVVDTTLHHLLWTLEQETRVEVAVRVDDDVVPSLREASDGLAGELYEWIPRFTGQRYERP